MPLGGKSSKDLMRSAKSVVLDVKQYLSFFIGLLLIQIMFFTVLTANDTNSKNIHNDLSKQYKYHFMLTELSHNDYTRLQNQDNLFSITSELWPDIEYLGKDNEFMSEATYSVGITLKSEDPAESEALFSVRLRKDIKLGSYTRINTPLYTDDPLLHSSKADIYMLFFFALALVALIFGVLAHKCKYPKRDNGAGERIYRSTASESAMLTAHRIFFVLMLIFGGASLTFFLLRVSLGNGAAYFLLYLFLLALSVMFMTSLFNVRVNHYKFTYGIYMAFGAGFRKLYSSAVLEMLCISFITLIPSVLISFGIISLIYASVDVAVNFALFPLISLIILNIMIVFASTYIPMKAMALQSPVTLLYSQDNSNLVSSPQRSAKIFRKSFPWVYESLGMWRFRTYFVKLTAIAVSFTTVFLCGLYLADTINASSSQKLPEFVAEPEAVSDLTDADLLAITDALAENPTLDYVFWTDSVTASSLISHALIHTDNTVGTSPAYEIKGNGSHRYKWLNAGYSMTTDSFEFFSYNEALLNTIVSNSLYEIEGDPYSVLNSSRTVIVSEYINGKKCFDFNVGDKIVLATPDFVDDGDLGALSAGNRKMYLEQLISRSDFSYEEYTVGAVINHSGSDGAIVFGLNSEAYARLTKVSTLQKLSVFTDSNATEDELESLHRTLKNEFSLYDYSVSRTYSSARSRLYTEARHNSVIITVSCVIMLISPLIWFFSQLNFFKRRDNEMFVLTAIGTVQKKLRSLYLVSGTILAALSAVMTLAVSYIADYLIYLICTQLIPSLTPVSDVVVNFYMPPIALVMCLVTAIICGFLSSVLPFTVRKILLSKAECYTSNGM